MAAVSWSVDARLDLQAIFDHIARDSLTYALNTVERVFEATDRLEDNPRLGRMVPEYQSPAIRELIVGSYRVIYELQGDERVTILAVVHGSRDIVRRLGDEPHAIT